MTDKEQVEDAVERLFILMNKESNSDEDEGYNWFESIPILVVTPVNPEDCKKVLIESLLNWIPESHMNDHISGFIIQHKAIFDKWYETLKLNTKNDTTTTNSIT